MANETPLHAVVQQEFDKAQEKHNKAVRLYNDLKEQTEQARILAHISGDHLEYWREVLHHSQSGPAYPGGGVPDGE